MKIKSSLAAGAALVLGMLLTGCVTHPLELGTTDYDKQTYDNSKDRQPPKGSFNIAVDSQAKGAGMTDARDHRYVKPVGEAGYAAAVAKLNNLGWFKVVDRKNAGQNAAEANANGANVDIAADLVLYIKSEYTFTHKEKTNRTTVEPKDAGQITILSDFRLEKPGSSQPVLATQKKNAGPMHRKYQEVKDDIPLVMGANLDDFAKELASRFLPGVPVVETRGSGKVARIGMGKNYALKTGSKVDFFTDAPSANGNFDRRVFATGTVLADGLEAKQCWVEVDNFETANVHVNHAAKVQE